MVASTAIAITRSGRTGAPVAADRVRKPATSMSRRRIRVATNATKKANQTSRPADNEVTIVSTACPQQAASGSFGRQATVSLRWLKETNRIIDDSVNLCADVNDAAGD